MISGALLSSSFVSLLWLPAAVAAFLLPGWILSRRLPSPLSLYTAFISSAAVLFALVLLLDAFDASISPASLGIGMVLVSAGLTWRFPQNRSLLPPRPTISWPRGWTLIWLIPPVFALISIGLRTVLDPLSGFDHDFRWDYLARLLLSRGSLAGYPPITAADFERYGWCDGIPPLIALLNYWLYAFTGSTAPVLTAVRVIGEAVLLGLLVGHYSRLLWGSGTGVLALAALASSPLVLWSVAMGQETGLTALSLVGMLYFLELHAREPKRPYVFWAAVAAGVGALAREYGLAFAPLGLAVMLARRHSKNDLAWFIAVIIFIAAPWYLRNWIVTGNPIYPLRLGGLLPGNALHDETMRFIADFWGLRTSPVSSAFLFHALSVLAGVLVIAGLIGAWKAGRNGRPVIGGIALITALWLWSIPYTGGGWIYSARVLSPALALLAVLAGGLGKLPVAGRVVCAAFFLGGAVDASRRSWLLPENPLAPALSFSFEAWRVNPARHFSAQAKRTWDILVPAAAGQGIVVDHASNHAFITTRGGRAVPLFSPLLAPTFSPYAEVEATLRYLRDAKIRFIGFYLSERSTTQGIAQNHPFWTAFLSSYRPNASVGTLAIFDLEMLEPSLAVPISSFQPLPYP